MGAQRGELNQGWDFRKSFSIPVYPVLGSLISLESREEFGPIKGGIAGKVILELKMVLSFSKNIIICIT